MRIKVTGTESILIASALHEAGFPITEHSPSYHIQVNRKPKNICPIPVIDGVDCELERRFVNFLAELTPSGRMLLQRAGGNQDDQALYITVPDDEKEIYAAERAIVRTFLSHRDRNVPKSKAHKLALWLFSWSWVFILLLAPEML